MRVRIHLACLENRRCSVPFWAGIARPRKGEDAGEGERRLGSGGRTVHSDEQGGGGRKKKKKGRERELGFRERRSRSRCTGRGGLAGKGGKGK